MEISPHEHHSRRLDYPGAVGDGVGTKRKNNDKRVIRRTACRKHGTDNRPGKCRSRASPLARQTLPSARKVRDLLPGLRLAYAACKGIQLAASCTLRPVAPLPCYAHQASEWPGAVISVLDAKKNRFYAQVFRRGTPVTDALDVAAKDIMQFVDAAERILVVGPDAMLFSSTLADAVPSLDLTTLPSGTNGISDIMVIFAENENAHYNQEVPDHAGPVYVRKSDAETNQG